MGRRIARTENGGTVVYVQSGQQTLCDYPSGAAPSAPTYRYGSYIDEPFVRLAASSSASIYYHRNQQYSVVALTNQSGSIVERYAYTALDAEKPFVQQQKLDFYIPAAHDGQQALNDVSHRFAIFYMR